jgi:hypothetical protein
MAPGRGRFTNQHEKRERTPPTASEDRPVVSIDLVHGTELADASATGHEPVRRPVTEQEVRT